jgi:hypothetical protein
MGQGPPEVVQRLGAQNGDVRPPSIYRLNSNTNAVENVTPATPEVVDYLNHSVGIRMAATHDDVVMLGSLQPDPEDPTNPEGRAVQFIALEGSTGRYLGLSQRYVGWSDIREGIEANGELYIGVRGPIDPQTIGGLVLKWHGNKANPFGCPAGAPPECVDGFETVGKLDTEPAFFTVHDGRLAIDSWAINGPGTEFGPTTIHGPAGTYLSPTLPKRGGLTAADADPRNWPMIFNWGQYDPDPLIQDAMWMGDIISWRGRLFLGTYASGGAQQLGRLWNAVGRPSLDLDKLRDMNAANKPVHLFEIENAGKRNQKVTLLYGEAQLPVFQGGSGAGRWVMQPNKLGQTPKFGPGGFIPGNIGAGYQWNWTVLGDRLYMSTSDITNPATLTPMMKVAFDLQPDTTLLLDLFMRLHFALFGGADMWRMDSPDRPAVAETVHGYAGDRYIWGCRAFTVFADKGFFYCGTAQQYNLRKGFDIVKFTPQSRPVGPPIEPPFSGDLPEILPPVGVIG